VFRRDNKYFWLIQYKLSQGSTTQVVAHERSDCCAFENNRKYDGLVIILLFGWVTCRHVWGRGVPLYPRLVMWFVSQFVR